jgi:hypothetical protein
VIAGGRMFDAIDSETSLSGDILYPNKGRDRGICGFSLNQTVCSYKF